MRKDSRADVRLFFLYPHRLQTSGSSITTETGRFDETTPPRLSNICIYTLASLPSPLSLQGVELTTHYHVLIDSKYIASGTPYYYVPQEDLEFGPLQQVNPSILDYNIILKITVPQIFNRAAKCS